MNDIQKLERLDFLSSLSYSDHPLYKPMTTYEVRVTQTHVDYYRINAKDQNQAKALIRQHINEGDTFIEAEKVDTILRPSEIDYAVKVDSKGEVIYQ